MTRPIDLRSDTVTQPSKAMRRAMAAARVGDDVLGDDPTVQELEARVAELLGKPAAVYVPSGTMANQVALRAHTEPGDEIIADADSHIIHYEGGAPAAISGLMIAPIKTERGIFTADQVAPLIRHRDVHYPVTRVVAIENTHNRGGGSVWPVEGIRDIAALAQKHKLTVHLDGARLLNACVALEVAPSVITRHVDSVTLCLSKGLGAPVGSLVAGGKRFIDRCRRFRKMLGGGMRQSGVLAAAGLYALEHNVTRLAEDHAAAREFADRLAESDCLEVDLEAVQTNMVFFNVPGRAETAVGKLNEAGVRVLSTGPHRIRAVTHLDARCKQVREAADIVLKTIG
ncbi:MAG: low-specificity L-threonine aldolase [Planctomycetota bacterium]